MKRCQEKTHLAVQNPSRLFFKILFAQGCDLRALLVGERVLVSSIGEFELLGDVVRRRAFVKPGGELARGFAKGQQGVKMDD